MNLQKIVRFVTIGALFLIPVFPLIVVDSFFFPFITGKAFYFRVLVEIALAGWIILAFLDPKYRPKLTPLTLTVTLFTLVTLIADLIGVNPIRSIWSNFERMEGWLVIAHLWAFFMATVHTFGTEAEGRKMWHRWLNMSLVISGMVAIHGIFQLFGWADVHQGSTRIDASLGNAAYMAVYMLIHTFLAAYMFFVSREHKRTAQVSQWVYAVATVIFGFLVFQTATRGTMLALIGGIVLVSALWALFANKITKNKVWAFVSFLVLTTVLFVMYAFGVVPLAVLLGVIGVYYLALAANVIIERKHTDGRTLRWVGISVITAMFALAGIFMAVRDTQFVRDSEVFNRLASISLTESKTQARGYIWPMAIEGFKERPILGWGQENFNYVFNANYNTKMWNQEQWFDRAHNVFLDWLSAAGGVGLIVYLALYVFAFMAIWKSSIRIEEKSVLTGLVAAYAVHNIFVFDNLASYVLFFAVLGFVNMYVEPKSLNWMGKKPVRQDAVEYIVAPTVVVLLIAGLYFLNARPIQANKNLIVALSLCSANRPDATYFDKVFALNQPMANQEAREQLLHCTGGVLAGEAPGPTKSAFATLVSNEIQKQLASTPDDARAYVLAGAFYNSIGQFQLALPLLQKAWELSPNKQSIGLQLANAYLNTGKQEDALALLKGMYELTPTHIDVKSMYAKMLILAGREAEAKALAGDEVSLIENESVAQIYASLKRYNDSIALYKKLIAADPKNINLRAQLAQTYVAANMKAAAIDSLRTMIPEFPEYKSQIETTITQIQQLP
jgi:tetratricopeptide (TPR) repeat protein